MLKFIIPDRKKPYTPVVWPPTSYTHTPPSQTNAVNIELYKEAQRRDKLIKELVKTLTYKVGDKVVPVKNDTPDEEAIIVGICSCYAHMGKDSVWPKSDNPMIVTARKNKDSTVYFCTTNYLKKV